MELKANRFALVRPLLVLVFFLLLIEVALELRHYLRCYDTPLFGQKNCAVTSSGAGNKSSANQGVKYGSISVWPYRSVVPEWAVGQSDKIEEQEIPDAELIWIASSSHAEHSRLPAEKVFPNKICAAMHPESLNNCLVVNGSRAGNSIERNINTLEEAWFVQDIDAAVLYQMAIFLAREQNRAGGGTTKSVEGAVSYKERMTKTFQRTSLYSHLSEYVGSTVKLASFRKADLEGAEERWEQLLKDYISVCKRHGITPVLTTFAAAYDTSNISSAPVSLLRTLVRENKTLSPEAYVNIIERLNWKTQQIGKEQDVIVIDIAQHIGGRPKYFVDMVHFNPKGHALVASVLGTKLSVLNYGSSLNNEL